MKFTRVLLGSFLSAALSTSYASDTSSDYIEVKGTAVATYEKFKSPSQARLMALRGAKVDALRNISEAINGVNVVSGSIVKDMVLESDTIGTKVKGIVNGAFQVSDEVTKESDGYVAEVTLGICLTRKLSECASRPALSAVLASNVAENEASSSDTLEVTNIPSSVSNSDSGKNMASNMNNDDASPYTGLIVDVRGLNAEKSMFSRIYNEEGKLVYGASRVNREILGDLGTIWYDDTIKGAIRIKALGDNPLIVKAKQLASGSRTDVVLTDKDARNVIDAEANNGFMSNANVAFVIN